MINLILRFIGGPIITGIIDAYKLRLEAAQTTERISADLALAEIQADIQARAAAKSIIIAEQGRWFTALPRPLFATIVLIYFGKVVIWDSVLGWGTTPAINGAVGEWMGWIVAAYFLGRTVEKTAQIVRGR